VLIFAEGGKTGEPGEKPLKHRREPTNHMHSILIRNALYLIARLEYLDGRKWDILMH
jgi:hypothetical protein